MVRLDRHETLSPLYLATTRRNASFACQLSLKASTRLFNACGGRVLASGNSLERQYRNLLGAASHHGMNWEVAAATFGAIMLGDQGES